MVGMTPKQQQDFAKLVILHEIVHDGSSWADRSPLVVSSTQVHERLLEVFS